MDLSWNVKQGRLCLLGRDLWETNLLQHIIWIKALCETQACQCKVLRGPAWQIQRESSTYYTSSLTALPVLGTATKAEVYRGEEIDKMSNILRLGTWKKPEGWRDGDLTQQTEGP